MSRRVVLIRQILGAVTETSRPWCPALTATAILAKLGDARRFTNSRRTVQSPYRHEGGRARRQADPGRISRQDPLVLRAGRCTRRPYAPPDRAPDPWPHRLAVKERQTAKRATRVAGKLARAAHTCSTSSATRRAAAGCMRMGGTSTDWPRSAVVCGGL
jgi:hypothetical protein